MKKNKYLFIVIVMLSLSAKAQIITTIAGGGSNTNDSIPALLASIYHPIDLVFDRYGNLYFCSGLGHKIQRVDTNGILRNIAGTGSGGYNGDGGLANTSMIKNPGGITVDSLGNLFIADKENHRIRKVDITTGIISTIAGTGTSGYNGENISADTAQLFSPADVCFDKFGNLYVSELGNARIRRISPTGTISTYVGTGVSGNSGDGGLAEMANIELPQELKIDFNGNLYFSDFGSNSTRVRKVDKTTGIISTIAGTGTFAYNGDNILATMANISPVGIDLDNENNLYIADWLNNRVRKINENGIIQTVAGIGTMSYSGDGGLATNAELNRPVGVTFDSCGNLYIGEIQEGRIRKVTYNNCLPASVNELSVSQLNIYPNPANTQISITANGNLKYLSVSNTLGQVVLHQNISKEKTELDIANLQPGVYYVTVKDASGGKLTRKIVKE